MFPPPGLVFHAVWAIWENAAASWATKNFLILLYASYTSIVHIWMEPFSIMKSEYKQ